MRGSHSISLSGVVLAIAAIGDLILIALLLLDVRRRQSGAQLSPWAAREMQRRGGVVRRGVRP